VRGGDRQVLDLRGSGATRALRELPSAESKVEVADGLRVTPRDEVDAVTALLELEPVVVPACVAGQESFDRLELIAGERPDVDQA